MPLTEGETGMVLALPKLSYAPPQPDVLICRKGYLFTHARRIERDAGADLSANAEQVLNALTHENAKGRQHSKTSLEAVMKARMPRVDYRDAVNTLLARGDLVLVKSPRKGGPQHYLQAAPNDNGGPSE
jgi:hypothetical protein